jgi:hypothetical protein
MVTRSSTCHSLVGGGGQWLGAAAPAPSRAAEHAAGVRVAAMEKKFASSSKPHRG